MKYLLRSVAPAFCDCQWRIERHAPQRHFDSGALQDSLGNKKFFRNRTVPIRDTAIIRKHRHCRLIRREWQFLSDETVMHRSLAAKQEQVAARQFRKTHALRILRRAVDHCQELILLTDADGVLQYVNPSCEMVTGYSASELINQKVSCIASQTLKGDSWDSM